MPSKYKHKDGPPKQNFIIFSLLIENALYSKRETRKMNSHSAVDYGSFPFQPQLGFFEGMDPIHEKAH